MSLTVTCPAHNDGMETLTQRGRLRLYLGTGPGTGKTHAMLQEGHRLAAGRDTVVAACDVTGAAPGLGALAGLELVGHETGGGLDVASVLRRSPEVALVDRLSTPGRWAEVDALLAAGIDVVATVDVTEIEALSDTVEAITDLPVDKTVPDAVLEEAAEIHLVDATPTQRGTLNGASRGAAPWTTDPAARDVLRQVAMLWLADRLDPGSGAGVGGAGQDAQERPRNRPARSAGGVRHQVTTGPPLPAGPSGWRLAAGWALALLGTAGLTGILLAPPVHLALPLMVQLFLAHVVLVALVGGIWPAVAAALVASACLNWFFTPPRRTWIIHDQQDVAALALFVLVAVAVASVVHRNVSRTARATRAEQESAHYGELATSLLASPAQLDLLLSRALQTFDARRAAVIRDEEEESIVLASGEKTAGRTERSGTVTHTEPIDARHRLVLEGSALTDSGRRLLRAYAATASAILTRAALQDSASAARALERDNVARTALLSAVSHDLRTPLASIKAAVSGLLDTTASFSPEDQDELLHTIDDSSDELDALIADLLDVSRLHEGSLVSRPTAFPLAEALPPMRWPDRVQVSPGLRDLMVIADRALLERVVANLVDNALAHAGPQAHVEVTAVLADDRVRLLVRDDGHGLVAGARETMFLPFQRRGDARSGHVGLGLAIARGLVEAMDGTITASETPGGGLTMVIDLPAARPRAREAQK